MRRTISKFFFGDEFQTPSTEYNPDCRASAKLIDAVENFDVLTSYMFIR